MEPVEVEKYDFIRLPKKDVWGILMPEDDPLAQKNSITPADLQTLPLIVSWRIVEREARAWFGGDTDHLHVICTYDLIDNAALLVERRLGYAFVIEGALKNYSGLVFDRFPRKSATPPYWYGKSISLLARRFRNLLNWPEMPVRHNGNKN